MKKAFNIYPAPFTIAPNFGGLLDDYLLAKGKINLDSNDSCLTTGMPQRYYGDCEYNTKGTTIFIRFQQASAPCFFIVGLPESLFNGIKPEKFNGKKYTITYLEVNN